MKLLWLQTGKHQLIKGALSTLVFTLGLIILLRTQISVPTINGFGQLKVIDLAILLISLSIVTTSLHTHDWTQETTRSLTVQTQILVASTLIYLALLSLIIMLVENAVILSLIVGSLLTNILLSVLSTLWFGLQKAFILPATVLILIHNLTQISETSRHWDYRNQPINNWQIILEIILLLSLIAYTVFVKTQKYRRIIKN